MDHQIQQKIFRLNSHSQMGNQNYFKILHQIFVSNQFFQYFSQITLIFLFWRITEYYWVSEFCVLPSQYSVLTDSTLLQVEVQVFGLRSGLLATQFWSSVHCVKTALSSVQSVSVGVLSWLYMCYTNILSKRRATGFYSQDQRETFVF